MTFQIIAEGHSGVVDCDEEVLCKVEAADEKTAMMLAANQNPRIHFSEHWQRWIYGQSRHIFTKATV